MFQEESVPFFDGVSRVKFSLSYIKNPLSGVSPTLCLHADNTPRV